MNNLGRFGTCSVIALTLLLSPARTSALNRVPNTTLNIPLEPQQGSYTVEEAFGTLNFTRPVAIVAPPGETNRLFIVEKQGIISVITNLAAPSRAVFMNIDARVTGGASDNDEQGLLGLAFHPQYASNGYFYVYYTGSDITDVSGTHDILSRFQVQPGNPNQGNATSEVKLLRQYDLAGNHNGGDLHFGPDGYLYLSLGDEGGGNDQYNNSQKIDADFFAGILRLDVDQRPGGLTPNPHPAVTTNYLVPPDNPFVGATNFNGSAVSSNSVRTEFWAVGLRNPWRMSFDPGTGDLLCGDVGQNAREEINLIVKGGNYGWAFREGTLAGPKSAPPGFQAIEPLLDYPRSGVATNIGTVVIGGITYRGARNQELYGAYVFADAASGNVWAMRHNRTNATEWRWLATHFGISAFGTDPRNGDILMAAQANNRIRRLVPSSSTGTPPPPTLADAGVFSDLSALSPQAGVVPYALNVPFWSDGALKSRWFSVPNTNAFIQFSANGNWSFPTGTVWVKHFELELTNGSPASRKRLETRLLIKNASGVHGLTYRWGNSLTNATLVAEGGTNESFVINDGGGLLRTQAWHYPSRSECLACHTSAGGHALGFNTAQLNRTYDLGAGEEQQLQALSDAGYFTQAITNRHLLPRMPELDDATTSREHRVRAYLAANCAQCHGPGGPTPALWDARFATPTATAGIIGGALINGGSSNKVIARGSLDLSAILQRISMRGPGQMPPLASTEIDAAAVQLVAEWITNDLPSHLTFTEWQVAQFGSTNAPGAGATEDFDLDGDGAYLEFLIQTDPKSPVSRWRLKPSLNGNVFTVGFDRTANRGYEVEWSAALGIPNTWVPLNVPLNAPAFTSSNVFWTIPDPGSTTNKARNYRVRVYER